MPNVDDLPEQARIRFLLRLRRFSRRRLILAVYITLVVLTFSELLLEFTFAHFRVEELKSRSNQTKEAFKDSSWASLEAYDANSLPGRIRTFMLLLIDNVVIK